MLNIPLFSEYLASLPSDIAYKLCMPADSKTRRIISASFIAETARLMSAEESLVNRFEKLSKQARYTCALVYLFGKRGFVVDKIAGFDDELMSSFLVFAGSDNNGRVAYYGFAEFEQKLLLVMSQAILDAAKPVSHKSTGGFLPWFCISDVTMLCVLASREMLRRTKTGALAKVTDTAFHRFLHASRVSHGFESAAGLSAQLYTLVLDYALDRALIFLDTEIYRPVVNNIRAWMEKPLAASHDDFCEFVFSELPLFSRPFFDGLFDNICGKGITLTSLDSMAKHDANQSVCVLAYCGLADVEKHSAGLSFTKKTIPDLTAMISSLPHARVILLPDFSAILTQEALPQDLYWFSKVGTIDSFDKVYKGEISRSAVNDALSEGSSASEILTWFSLWNAPHNVVATVTEWIREFSRMYVTTDATILSFDEKATRQILAYTPLKKLVEPVSAHSVFRIKQGYEREVSELIMTMGFDPRVPGESVFRKKAEPLDLAVFSQKSITAITDFDATRDMPLRSVKDGKYGAALKQLDGQDLYHVLDYAMLTGTPVTFEYKGSPLIKKGKYTVDLKQVQKSGEPFIDTEVLPKRNRKKFLVKCILTIGVGAL